MSGEDVLELSGLLDFVCLFSLLDILILISQEIEFAEKLILESEMSKLKCQFKIKKKQQLLNSYSKCQ